MPYINVQVTREGVTREQKIRIIEGVTRLLQEVLHKDPNHTHVVIQEIETDNWGLAGQSTTELRRATQSPAQPA